MTIETICVVGLGYIGLPTAAVFASRGRKVIGLEVDPRIVATINRGEIHIVEPGLAEVVSKAAATGMLRATTTAEPADAFLIAVPTPFTDGRKPDLRYVESAARAIAPALKRGDVVILESTSPVGATEAMAGWLHEERPDLRLPGAGIDDPDLAIAHCPERVLPGQILHELVHNDRVIGGLTPRCAEAAAAVYRTIVEGACITTSARTAELCKLTENSFRDVNIAFANELSMICDGQGIDVWELISLANRHPRVNILRPGTGVGGHCIAVDPWFIVDTAPDEAQLIKHARIINDAKPHWVVGQIEALAKDLPEARIACMGLAYKPDVDDLRESPSVEVAHMLTERFPGRVAVCEPFVDALPPVLAESDVALVDTETAIGCDIVVFLTAHSQFRELLGRLDGRRVLNPCGLGI